MRKIFFIVFAYFIFFLQVFSYDKPEIVTRKEWGANENYTYLDSPEWQEILKKQEKKIKNPLSSYEKKVLEKKRLANNFIVNNFGEFLKTYGKIDDEKGRILVWPIKYSKKIRAITIHHTESDYKDSITGINQIFKYHSLNNKWGDIGYNFVIGYDGKIYEGRKGGEISVGAHAKWNNTQNIGISVMGSYSDKSISEKQYKALKKLVYYLVEKYDIDMTKKQAFFKECFRNGCKTPIIVNYKYPLIGHRDAGNTDCPGDRLYEDTQNLRLGIFIEQLNYKKAKERYFPIFDKSSKEKLQEVSKKIEIYLEKGNNKKIEKIGKLLKDYLKDKRTNLN